ncbi:MAG: hypothetical protein Q9191_007323 [Dirinaria sp. TL-2023a]
MTLLFSRFCDLLHDLECFTLQSPPLSPASLRQQSKDRTVQWLSSLNVCISNTDINLVALLSALFPKRRTDRVYGIQPPKLTKKLKRILGLGNGRHQLLDRWQEPGRGDLGDCVERALRLAENPIQPAGRQVKLEEVDIVLARIAAGYRFSAPKVRAAHTAVSEPQVDSLLQSLYSRMQSREAKWLTRLILKEYGPLEIVESVVYKCIDVRLPIFMKTHANFEDAIEKLRRDADPISAVGPQPCVGVKVGRTSFEKARSIKHAVNLIQSRKMSVERKYDGEYCQIHVDRTNMKQQIQIFSKSGKDSTLDRSGLHETLRECLRLDNDDCAFSSKCVLEGEMVVWSDREQKILEFHKIRKLVSRSGSFLGTIADSLPHPHEHLMIVLFDVLLVDDASLLSLNHASRRQVLERIVLPKDGRAALADRLELDFSSPAAPEELRRHYARAIAKRWEGLVIKPSSEPYFGPLRRSPGDPRSSWIKLKKDYIAGLGDTADFAVVGAGYDATAASKCGEKHLSWTHFHIACLKNKDAVVHLGAKPLFVVLDAVNQSLNLNDLKHLNQHGQFYALQVGSEECKRRFDFEYSPCEGPKMTVAFRRPFIFEVMGGGFVKLANSEYHVLRWPRVLKMHEDRQWEKCVTLDELQRMAKDAATVPHDNNLKEESTRWQERLEKADRGVRNTMLPWDDSQGRSMSAEPTTTPPRSAQRSGMPVASPMVRMDTCEMLPNEQRTDSGEVVCHPSTLGPESKKISETCLPTAPASPPGICQEIPGPSFSTPASYKSSRRSKKRLLEVVEETEKTSKKARTGKGKDDIKALQQTPSSENRANPSPSEALGALGAQSGFSLVPKVPPGVNGLPIKSRIKNTVRIMEPDSPDRQTTASERSSQTTSSDSQQSSRASMPDAGLGLPGLTKNGHNAFVPPPHPRYEHVAEEVGVPDLLSSPVMLSGCISRSAYFLEELLPGRVGNIVPLPHLVRQAPLPTPPPSDPRTYPQAILLVETNNYDATASLVFSIIPFLYELPYAGIQVWDWTLLKLIAKGETRQNVIKDRFFANMWYDAAAREFKLRWQDGMLKRLKVASNGEIHLVGKAWVDGDGWLHEVTKLEHHQSEAR